jgi:hypothetical protein
MPATNTLTGLIPVVYEAMDVVSREPVGFIQSVTIDASAARAAKDQDVTSPVAPASASVDITPSNTAPNTGGQTIGKVTYKITKSKAVPIQWNGEEQLSLGGSYRRILRDQIANALRTLTNEVEADIAALYKKTSRAYGTAGTTPFASDLSDPAQVRKILQDNGAPLSDIHMTINTTAGAKLRTLAQLTKANEAASSDTLRRGSLLDLHGFAIRESAGIGAVTKGTGSGYLVNNVAGYAVGDTAITLDTGSGTILAGDVVTFAGDTNKYVVATALAANVVTLAAPGLRQTLANDVALTVGNNFTPNMAYSRSALLLLARQPAVPEGGDAALDRIDVQDPVSGIVYEFAAYPGYRQVHYELGLSWGVENIKPEHSALLIG